MQALLLDELRTGQLDNLRQWLNQHVEPAILPDTWWLVLPMFSPQQAEHTSGCGPFCLAIVLEESCLRLELLVRARQSLHCSCIAMATLEQRQFALDFWDEMLGGLKDKPHAH